MIAWTRNRVVNFSHRFAQRYIEVLVALDGQPYDQPLFHKFLVDAGLVNEVSLEGDEQTVAERRRKRWDSYLGKIREFGIGFAVDERKKGSVVRTFWRASDIAKDFAAGRLNYRQFMALQCMRQQLPKPAMPLQRTARTELERGVQIVRPLHLILNALEMLAARGAGAYLSRDDIFQRLTQVEQHNQLGSVIESIVAARDGPSATSGSATESAEPSEIETEEDSEEEAIGQASQDIWLNEFEATGYIRQLRPAGESGLPPHIVVRRLPRWEEALLLAKRVPIQPYDTSQEAIDDYFTFLSSSPSEQQLEVLTMDERVVQLEVPTEVEFDPAGPSLRGKVEIVGGLTEGSLVLLTGDNLNSRVKATVYEVMVATSPHINEPEVTVRLQPALIRADQEPIDLGDTE